LTLYLVLEKRSLETPLERPLVFIEKMIRFIVDSLDGLKEVIAEQEPQASKIILLFMASIDPSTGKSWCPDCRAAEPVVEDALTAWIASHTQESKTAVFVTVYVGQKPEWKDPNCVWRGEPYKLKSVPTLIVNEKEGRMEEEQLLDKNAILKFIE